ncbi:MAG: hypothetical protein ACRD24_05165 [Terriglobales bacterium]
MTSAICKCGHEKRDHRLLALALQGYGECKVCLCSAYTRIESANGKAAAPATPPATPAT